MIIKNILKKIIGKKILKNFHEFKRTFNVLKRLHSNFYIDLKLFKEHSTILSKDDTPLKIESTLILDYHSVEKGLIHKQIRFRFGEKKIRRLLVSIDSLIKFGYVKQSQFVAACSVLANYYEIHLENKVDIKDYFSYKDYCRILKFNNSSYSGIIKFTSNSYFSNSQNNFLNFSNSRHSVRDYTGEIVSETKIVKSIDIAKNAPSVCNRQPNKVYLINNKSIIDEALAIQGGITGFSNNINQLLVITTNRNFFYSIGEKNQLYIDGGLFVMNLLYSLHFNEIGACPLHWGMENKMDRLIEKILDLKKSEKVICFISIGIPTHEFKITGSMRRDTNEILNIIN